MDEEFHSFAVRPFYSCKSLGCCVVLCCVVSSRFVWQESGLPRGIDEATVFLMGRFTKWSTDLTCFLLTVFVPQSLVTDDHYGITSTTNGLGLSGH